MDGDGVAPGSEAGDSEADASFIARSNSGTWDQWWRINELKLGGSNGRKKYCGVNTKVGSDI